MIDLFLEWISESSDLKSLTLHFYGNLFSIKKMIKLVMVLKTFELTELTISYFDFVNQYLFNF